jgi:hypothetical protein
MNIDRNNYEEYFILYLDNELSPDERCEVEAFAKTHPDLQEELDTLLQSKLVPDQHIVFEGKEELFSFNSSSIISLSNYEEWLLLYMDNELTVEQRTTVEQFAAVHPAVQGDLRLLLQTKSEPEHEIVFPDKELLYRREEKTRPIIWWRIAAAAAVLIAIVTTLMFTLNKKKGPARDLASSGKTEQPAPAKNIDQQHAQTFQPGIVVTDHQTISQPGNHDDKVVRAVKNNNQVNDKKSFIIPAQEKQQQTLIATKDNISIPVNNNDQNNVNTANNANADRNEYASNNTIISNNTLQQQNSNKSGVTDQFPDTYTKVDGSANTDDNKAVIYASENSSKKGKLRGFLRKVTRTFEKQTNIDATDDDDRLLVGGLAIRL